MPGFFVSSHILDLPAAYASQFEMAYFTVPEDEARSSLAEFRQFMKRHKLGYDHLTARLYAYSAARTIVEGIKRSGKRITRDKLVAALEELYSYDAGLNKPLSYGSRRRTGLSGAFVVKLDTAQRRLLPTGIWVKLDQVQ